MSEDPNTRGLMDATGGCLDPQVADRGVGLIHTTLDHNGAGSPSCTGYGQGAGEGVAQLGMFGGVMEYPVY